MKWIVVLALVLALSGCHDWAEEVLPSKDSEEAAGAPAKDAPVGWTAENLRIKSYVTTAEHIVVWMSYEEDGTRSVSRKIYIEK